MAVSLPPTEKSATSDHQNVKCGTHKHGQRHRIPNSRFHRYRLDFESPHRSTPESEAILRQPGNPATVASNRPLVTFGGAASGRSAQRHRSPATSTIVGWNALPAD